MPSPNRRRKPENERCRGIGISLTPEDEEYLMRRFPGTWADAMRAVIQESRNWHGHVKAQAGGLSEACTALGGNPV